MFSATVIESKRALFWKSMPNLQAERGELELGHREHVLAVDDDRCRCRGA